MANKYFLTAIGTNVGKTLVSAVLCEALNADYWKPVQAGGLDNTDSNIVGSLVSNNKTRIHTEEYSLKTACSPHLAAKLDNVHIDLENIKVPNTDNVLIVEGAGGVLVPLNEEDTVLDLIKYMKLPVILVSQNYLGSINHTMLSIEALKQMGIEIVLLVFNGASNPETEKIIKKMSGIERTVSIPELTEVNKETVAGLAKQIRDSIHEFIR